MFAFVLLHALISRLRSLLAFLSRVWPISAKKTMASSSSTNSAPGSYPLPTPPPYQPSTTSRASPTIGSQARPPSFTPTPGIFAQPRTRIPSAPTPSAAPSISTATTTGVTSLVSTAPAAPGAPVVSNGTQAAPGGEARLVIALDYGTTYTGTKKCVHSSRMKKRA